MENNNQQKVEASKHFSAPVEKLFEAWNNLEQLKQWWKPMGYTLQEVINDLAVGGTVRYVFEGDKLVIDGKYEEVKENEKLVYTWNWQFPDSPEKNGDYKLVVQFASRENGSELNITQQNLKSDEGIHPNEEGWDKALEELETFLDGNNSKLDNSGEQQKLHEQPEEAGYREKPEQQKVGGG
jgi:uncharacterized protein YndB with AHSA1/START domain